MGFNVSGLLATFQVVARPKLLLPSITVRDIRQLDLAKLRERGVIGVVIDKDNCLTKPKHDGVVTELKDAWPALAQYFGKRNVLVVSNSAGTRDDAGLLQAESVSRQLGAPVLLHAKKKPGCYTDIQTYFSALLSDSESYPAVPIVDASLRQQPIIAQASEPGLPNGPTDDMKIAVIGDRVMTDIVLANRMNLARAKTASTSSLQAIPILTTTVWQMEGFGSRIMRILEISAARMVMRFYKNRGKDPSLLWADCVRADASVLPSVPNVKAPATVTSRDPIDLLYRLAAYILSPLSRSLRPPMERLKARLAYTLRESRKIDYGYRLPATTSAILRFRRTIMGFGGVSRS